VIGLSNLIEHRGVVPVIRDLYHWSTSYRICFSGTSFLTYYRLQLARYDQRDVVLANVVTGKGGERAGGNVRVDQI
jgi:hypothetical protein